MREGVVFQWGADNGGWAILNVTNLFLNHLLSI